MNEQCAHCEARLTALEAAIGITVYNPHHAPFSETVAWFCGPNCLLLWAQESVQAFRRVFAGWGATGGNGT